jgi:AAA domain
MPTLDAHQSNEFTKMLLMGDSGTGKTGSLASLVAAGYKLRILDMDNGLETLKQFVLKDSPDLIGNVEFRTLRDKYKATSTGPVIAGQPRAFLDAIKMLDRWKYDDVDLGNPAEWGNEVILVLDSLTFFSDAAFNWAEPLVPSGRRSGEKDNRAVYGMAQDAVEKEIDMLTGDSFETNVVVISHVKYIENQEGITKGYPTSVGKALSPNIPTYFNSVALCQTQPGGKRTIQTAATGMIDLKNPKPFEMQPKYDISTGLADFFKVLREPPKQTTKLKLRTL